jgi:hypothetical protein
VRVSGRFRGLVGEIEAVEMGLFLGTLIQIPKRQRQRKGHGHG